MPPQNVKVYRIEVVFFWGFNVSYCGRRTYSEFKRADHLWAQHLKCNIIMIGSMKSCKNSLNKTLNDKDICINL